MCFSVPNVAYNRGGYNQNRWGNNYRDSGGRGGYNRNQQSGGSYTHNRQVSYNKGGSGASSSYSQSQVPDRDLSWLVSRSLVCLFVFCDVMNEFGI